MEKVVKWIIQNTVESEVHERIADLMHEFVADDWEDEFDDIFEAYEETGRNAAENQVLQEIIEGACTRIRVGLSDDEFCEVLDTIADTWCITT